MPSIAVRGMSMAFVLVFLLQPFAPMAAQAAQATNRAAAALTTAAQRMGVDPLFLEQPDHYLARAAAQTRGRRSAALADLAARTRPDPTLAASFGTEAAAIKDAHARSAVLGLLLTLDSAASSLADPAADPGALAGVPPLLAAGLQDLDRMALVERARLADNALALGRLDRFVTTLRDHLTDLQTVLKQSPPPGAAAGQQTAWRQHVLAALRTGDPEAAPARALPGLPTGPIHQGMCKVR